MQPASPRIVELFNEALTFELTVTNTYFLHARMLDNWGLSRLGKVFYDLSIDEMRDADAIINRILMFDGHPNVQRLNPIQVGESPEEMLELALASELAAVAQFNAAAHECHELGDHASAGPALQRLSEGPLVSRPRTGTQPVIGEDRPAVQTVDPQLDD